MKVKEGGRDECREEGTGRHVSFYRETRWMERARYLPLKPQVPSVPSSYHGKIWKTAPGAMQSIRPKNMKSHLYPILIHSKA